MNHFFKIRSSEETCRYYDDLANGRTRRGIWGKENRFDPDLISSNTSVLRHLVPVLCRHLTKDDNCLDLGCGPGGFLSLMAPLCRTIIGADITPAFVKQCRAFIERKPIPNARAVLIENGVLPFGDGEFDKVVLIDTIHHLEDQERTLDEIARVLKPGGLLLIFEPNKLNPLLTLHCMIDRNEHGLLKLGTFGSYRRLLCEAFQIEIEEYNGVLIGPKNKALVAIADYVGKPDSRLSWLSPKLFMTARKL